ncbi:MAG: helix-turn-helix transcriptional regulator [Turicibacter sp.]|nr:helix-turn-helix transcriptional regulator [Turicibacter sp.]
MSGFKKVLKKKGITQRQLAKEVGMSYQMICMYATGKVDMGSKKLYKIAKYLNVPMEELIEEVENESRKVI